MTGALTMGERDRDHGRPVRCPGTAVGDQDRDAALVDVLDEAVDRLVPVGGGETRREGARHGNPRRRLASSRGHDRLELAVVEAPRRSFGNVLTVQDGSEAVLRQDGGDEALHRAVVVVDPQAERDDRRPGLHETRHAARHRPPALPHPVQGFRVGREVPVPGKRRPERPEGVGDLSVEIAEDQPGSVGDRRRLELVVEAPDVARLQGRR